LTAVGRRSGGTRGHLGIQERIVASSSPEIVLLATVAAGAIVGYVDLLGGETVTRGCGVLIGERSRRDRDGGIAETGRGVVEAFMGLPGVYRRFALAAGNWGSRVLK
jgi:hypothetical protein